MHPTTLLSIQQPTHQIHLSPMQREECSGELCRNQDRSPDKRHLQSFLCPLMQSLHHRRPLGWSDRTFLWWSLLAILNHLPVLHGQLLHGEQFPGGFFCDLPSHRSEVNRLVGPRILLCSLFLKAGMIFPFFRSPGTSPVYCDFSNIMEDGLIITSANCLRTLQ